MKKIKMWLIILICVPIGYIGIHRIVYFYEYNRIKVLNTEIYQLKLDIIDGEKPVETTKKYKKSIAELEYLKNKTKYIN